MAGKAALEAELPELREPGVASVGAEPELEEVVVEGGDLGRLQLDRDATHRLLLEALHHLHSVRPAITAERAVAQGGERWWDQLDPFWSRLKPLKVALSYFLHKHSSIAVVKYCACRLVPRHTASETSHP